ncbi:MAG: 3'-5' exonuclease [Cuniculiplasma sp.]
MDIDIGLSRVKRRINGARRVMALDLETLVKGGFLQNEDIVVISVGTLQGKYDVLMADPDNYDEYALLNNLQELVDPYQPEVIIGFNHVSYDITLINTKLVKFPYSKQLFSLKYFFGTSYLLDMMYVCALDLRIKSGDYAIQSLKKIVNSELYSGIDLMRVKETLEMEGKNPSEAVEFLWKNHDKRLREYSLGDVHDVIELYKHILM